MGYIKFVLNSRLTDEEGYAKEISISRLESDMANVNTYELNLIMHAMAIKGLVQIVNSCFGAGYWVDDKPWLDDEAWKD